MNTPNFVVEGHYYSGGLRTTLFHESTRPEWLPPTDMVGFRDEFDLGGDDFAVEFRRFISHNRTITWLGIFYSSVDVKFGDRKNHAGVGVWIDDGVVVFPQKLLKALSQLAKLLSQDPEPWNLNQHVERFVGPSFLPTYLGSRLLFPPALAGIPFGEVSPCDTSLFSVELWDKSLNPWVRLANLMTNITFSPSPIVANPRVLVLASASALTRGAEQGIVNIGEEFDDVSQFLSQIRTTWSDASAKMQAMKAAEKELTTELVELKTLHKEALDLIKHHEGETANLNAQLNDLQTKPEAVIISKISQISRDMNYLRNDLQNLSRSVKGITYQNGTSPQHSPSHSLKKKTYDTSWLSRINIYTLLVAAFAFILIIIGVIIYDN